MSHADTLRRLAKTLDAVEAGVTIMPATHMAQIMDELDEISRYLDRKIRKRIGPTPVPADPFGT